MLRVDSVEGLLGVRAPFAYPVFGTRFLPSSPASIAVLAVLTPIFGYTRMHNFATASSRRCEFAHLCSGGVRPLYEARVWLHF